MALSQLTYGTCATEEATAEKAVTLSSYALTTGGVVAVKFTYAVPANATMNINAKDAKSIYYRGAKIKAGVIRAGNIATFIYNGSYYHLLAIDWPNNENNGIALGTCTTAASTVAKTASVANYFLAVGGLVAIKFTKAVPAGVTLNINGQGTKAIFYKNAAITASIIAANGIGLFVYDGTQYDLLAVG